MGKQNKWKMNRAGLLNFWYYDEEFFDFADGKLLLRGSNGSGKSVTMQSFLPVLLDGRTSPDRLDPFGSRARRMEDYLLGEKEIVDRDERTGYLFIEYRREDTDQYITTGIGLQARRHKAMNFWGFVITDNRRIGRDFNLYELERNAGEKQRIPLSRVQLENRIGNGGHVVRTKSEYRNLVNKYIFGFETADAYEDLIKLLIQLRSPKLSKDFRPTVIYDILEAALPPLTDEDLRHLSDTIEHMDQTKQQIEQLEREQTALHKLIQRYDVYNEYRVAEKAQYYLDASKRFAREEQELHRQTGEKQELEQAILEIRKGQVSLTQTKDVLEQKQNRLQGHKVWNLEKERADETARLKDILAEHDRKDQNLTLKKRRELTAKEEQEKLAATMTAAEAEIADMLTDMEADAEAGSFFQHQINTEDFRRNKQTDHDFTVWEKETEAHYHKLDELGEQLRKYEQLKKEIAELDSRTAKVKQESDQAKREENDWFAIFEKDKQELLNVIYDWAEDHAFLGIREEVLKQVSRDLYRLYEPVNYENIRAPFITASNVFQIGINEKKAEASHRHSELAKQLELKQNELEAWKAKQDPEPPNQREETTAARTQLKKRGHQFVPFYEAVEFRDSVPADVRNQLEAALLDSGLLDSLITSADIPVHHDRVIDPNPQVMAHTLADYLVPDLTEDAGVSAAKVDDVLKSIAVSAGGDNRAAVNEDGTYEIGILRGHAVPVARVRFIGRSARKRYREEQIAAIHKEMDELRLKQQEVQTEINSFGEMIQKAQDALETFPDDQDLQTSFTQIKEKRLEIAQYEKRLQELNEQVGNVYQSFQEIKRKLDTGTRDIDVSFSHSAYQEAKMVMRRYEKDLRNLITKHTTYRHTEENLRKVENRMEELALEVDDLGGELNMLVDRKTRVSNNIAEIEKQLESEGVIDIRRQIQEVQEQLRETEQELADNNMLLPKKESKRDVLIDQINVQQQKIRFSACMIEAWEETFSREIHHGFIRMPEEIEENEAAAQWAVDTFKQTLADKDPSAIEGQLTTVYFEQQTNLMEYRMTDTQTAVPAFDWISEEWTEEQRIQIANWQQKATRRLIQLDFQGKRVSPYYIRDMVENDRIRQQTMLDDRDRQLYEEILFDSVGKKLRSRINRAKQWTKKMDTLMQNSDSSSGLSFSIKWRPRTAETEAELDTKELVDLLSRDPRLLKEETIDQVIGHFRSRIERAKELTEIQGEGNTLLQVLKDVLDYRNWFSFVLSYQREGETKRELTNHAFDKFSGGEKAMAMYIPLFTACYSRYLEADPAAPYIISLDEAFAGVDENNISSMFEILEELGFDYMMNSQVLWGDYDTISSLSICELIRPKNADCVSVLRYHWDGSTRKLLLDKETESIY
jgi:uncharacterized protein (TIGR02680 family)